MSSSLNIVPPGLDSKDEGGREKSLGVKKGEHERKNR